jgi:signal transduction histidine kinase
MKEVAPIPVPQAETIRAQQDENNGPFLISALNNLPMWASMALGVLLYLSVGILVLFDNQNTPAWAIAGGEALYLLALALLLLMRRLPIGRRWVLLGVAVTLLLGVILGCTFVSLGCVIFDVIPLAVIYRFPWRQAFQILSVAMALFVAVLLFPPTLVFHQLVSPSTIIANLAIMVLVAWIISSLRSRSEMIVQLRASQAQLQAEMQHVSILAAAQERARIARDIHDVLAHSLTVLLVQTQATRQVINQKPEQAGQMIDEVVGMLRESIVESRRVVGLLQEATQSPDTTSPLGARLMALAERFATRTGMKYLLEGSGDEYKLTEAQEKALHFVLQEALTNAYRHGSAQHVWITLTWQPSSVSLEIRDDGIGRPALIFDGQGGHGLQGMRERAAALDGTLNAGPSDDGGFEVRLTLPVKMVDASKVGRNT